MVMAEYGNQAILGHKIGIRSTADRGGDWNTAVFTRMATGNPIILRAITGLGGLLTRGTDR